jgi:hypothetical protein
MSFSETQMKKVCNFYVSEWHMLTSVIPYVQKQFDKENDVIVVSKQELKEKVEILISRLNLKEENKNKILDLKYYHNIEDVKTNDKNLTIIISGENNFIENSNNKLKRNLVSKGRYVTVVNCYEILDTKQNMTQILNEHSKVLNVSGEQEINEAFPN